jgi:nitrite reductase/ring-hydroxylating ferredoxin subunit
VNDQPWQLLAGVAGDGESFPRRAKYGGDDIVVLRIGDGLRGVQLRCPHQQASLADAAVVGNGRMLRCALHGYTFKLTDGKGVNCPGFRVKVYEIMRSSDGLLAREAAVAAGSTATSVAGS